MTTTIAGPGPLFTQSGNYSALDLRRSEIMGPIQEGVYAAGDYQVTQRAAGGAALFVDIAAGAGAFACVQGDSLTGQGLYVVGPHSAAVITEAIATPDVSNPRIDIAVLEVFDNTLDASGLNIARVRVIAGSPTAGTTLNSRAGVAALPGSALLLADILVTAGATTVSNTQIRDRRKWARGAYGRLVVPANSASNATTAFVDAGSGWKQRIECSGVPLKLSLYGQTDQQPNASTIVAFTIDGGTTLVDGTSQEYGNSSAVAVGVYEGLDYTWGTIPSAGSHVFGVALRSNTAASTVTISGTAARPAILVVEEFVRQNTTNASVTSG